MHRFVGNSIIILLCLCPTILCALTLNVGNDSGNPGEVVQVSITLDDAVDIEDFGFTLLYDTDKLELDSLIDGTATLDWLFVDGTEALEGAVIAGYCGDGTPVNGSDQQLCVLNLSIASGASPGLIALNATSLTGDIEGADGVDGYIMVGSAPTPTPTPAPTITPTPTPSPTPGYQNLFIGSATGTPGTSVLIPVNLDSDTDVLIFGFDLLFDVEDLTFVEVQKGNATQEWFIVNGTSITSGTAVIGYAGGATPVSGTQQEICKIKISIAPDAPEGLYPLVPENLSGDIDEALTEPGSVAVATTAIPISFDFEEGTDGWQFRGQIPPYNIPATSTGDGRLGLSPQGQTNTFSYWESPEVQILKGKIYRARWTVSASVTDPHLALEFRLRANQLSNWNYWDRGVLSFNNSSPTSDNPKIYDMVMIPQMEDDTDTVCFSFDVLGFNPDDDLDSWIYLEQLDINEVNLVE